MFENLLNTNTRIKYIILKFSQKILRILKKAPNWYVSLRVSTSVKNKKIIGRKNHQTEFLR